MTALMCLATAAGAGAPCRYNPRQVCCGKLLTDGRCRSLPSGQIAFATTLSAVVRSGTRRGASGDDEEASFCPSCAALTVYDGC